LLPALVLPLLLSALLLPILALPLLLLGVLLPVLLLPRRLLSVLLLLFGLPLLLSMLRFGLGLRVLALLLLGMVLLLALLLMLCVSRSGDSEKQGQNGCANDLKCVHAANLRYCSLRALSAHVYIHRVALLRPTH